MSYIGKNIKKIRSVTKLSQAEFAKIFNLARPSVGAYEEERSEPKIDTLIEITNHFGISIDLILKKELSINEILSFDSLNKKLSRAHEQMRPSKNIQKDGIQVVSADAYSDYVVSHNSRDFISNLPVIDLPIHFVGLARCFEMKGNEMEYQQQGIHHGDLMLARKVNIKNLSTDYVNKILVFIDHHTIFIRRLRSVKESSLILSTDDPSYPEEKKATNEILELWIVEGLYTTYMNPPSLLAERLMHLENKVDKIISGSILVEREKPKS